MSVVVLERARRRPAAITAAEADALPVWPEALWNLRSGLAPASDAGRPSRLWLEATLDEARTGTLARFRAAVGGGPFWLDDQHTQLVAFIGEPIAAGLPLALSSGRVSLALIELEVLDPPGTDAADREAGAA